MVLKWVNFRLSSDWAIPTTTANDRQPMTSYLYLVVTMRGEVLASLSLICLERDANDLHSPADATATPSSLAPVKSRMVYLSGASLPRLSWKKRPLNGCSCSSSSSSSSSSSRSSSSSSSSSSSHGSIFLVFRDTDVVIFSASRTFWSLLVVVRNNNNYKCGPMPNVMVALPNIGGALCSTPQTLAGAH